MIRAEFSGISKSVNKAYAERSGVSAKILKIYSESGGVSKLVYTLGKIVSKLSQNAATADNLSLARCYIGTGSTANHAFFVGGADGSNNGTKNVDAYDINGIMTAATDFLYAQARATCVQNGDESDPVLLVFQGASTGSSASGSNFGYYYKDDLTRGGATNITNSVIVPATFYMNKKSYIAGGRNGKSYYKSCDCYTATNAQTVLSNLGVARGYAGGAATDDFGAIVGGMNASGRCADVDIYNKSNVRSSLTLSIGRQYPMAARIGDGIIVAGGNIDLNGGTSSTDIVEYINKDKVLTTIGNSLNASSMGCCVGGKDIAVFVDGAVSANGANVRTKDVEYVNSDLVATLSDQTRDEHFLGGVARLGNKVFVGGGSATGGARVDSVEIYDIKQEVITP